MRIRFLDEGGSFHKQLVHPKITETSNTSLSVLIDVAGMFETPATYTVLYRRWTAEPSKGGTAMGSEITVNSASNPVTISGLVAGGTYVIKTRASSVPFGTGNTLQVVRVFKGGASGVAITAEEFGSFIQLEGGKQNDNKYQIASRQFNGVQVPTQFQQTVTKTSVQPVTGPAYHTKTYYAFGTSIYLPDLETKDPQEAGFGFFMSENFDYGYVFMIRSSLTAEAADSNNVVRILKIQSNQIIDITPDLTNLQRLDTIYGGKSYNIDIKVQVGGVNSSDNDIGKIVIKASINGSVISVTDRNRFLTDSNASNIINPVTKRVAFIGASGTSSFDYAYATSINAESYDRGSSYNFYSGRYSDDYLISKFGDLLYVADAGEGQDNAEIDDSYDELGTTAREIVKREIAFTSPPAYPNNWSLGINSSVKILDNYQDGFRGSIFVLNNTSIPTVLSGSDAKVFRILGATIGRAGEQIYDTDPEVKYFIKEPVSFESTWIQTEEDAEKLAEFIKSKVVNKTRVIDMTVFGNPLISIGDIITLDFPYQDFDDEDKILVTNVTHDYNNGLSTQIRGRTI